MTGYRKVSRILGTLAIGLAGFTAGPTFAANPRNCYEVRFQNPMAVDGDYVIEPVQGRPFTVYCKDLESAPREYLTLVNTGGDYNFGQYSAGGASLGTDVRTNYTRIRIDPMTLLVDLRDSTFSTSTGALCHNQWSYPPCLDPYLFTSRPYGIAFDCVGFNTSTGRANIDLTGTPFAVDDTFAAWGWYPAGTVTFGGQTVTFGGWVNNGGAGPSDLVHVFGQVVDTTGGGYCGQVGPLNSYFNALVQLGFTDITPPASTVVVAGAAGANGWYVSPVTVIVTATDDRGVKEIHATVDGTESIVPGSSASLPLAADGVHAVSVFAVDVAGNVEAARPPTTVRIDRIAPTVASTSPAASATNVSRAASVVVIFREGVAPGSAFSGIALTRGATPVPASSTLSGSTLTLTPSTRMTSNTSYAVTVPAGAVVDIAGNPIAAPYTFTFRTGSY
jgi:Big-like domain-containing protein/GON domain-containing protein